MHEEKKVEEAPPGKPFLWGLLALLALIGGVAVPVIGEGDNLAFFLLAISLILSVNHIGALIVWHKES